MRRADWTDDEGRHHAVLLPDDADPAEAPSGIPLGPLDLSTLDLGEERERRLHNELHARGILTANDLRTRRAEAISAIAAALKLDVLALEQAWAKGVEAPLDGLEPVRNQPDYIAEEARPRRQAKPRRP